MSNVLKVEEGYVSHTLETYIVRHLTYFTLTTE
jgi:hypothetical protein